MDCEPIIRKEISLIQDLWVKAERQGILSFILAPAGMGKTTFLQQVQESFAKDEGMLCINEVISPLEDAIHFFSRLTHLLNVKIHPKRVSFIKLISRGAPFIKGGTQALGFVPRVPSPIPKIAETFSQQLPGPPPSVAVDHLKTHEELLKVLKEISRNQRVLILIDDLDAHPQKEVFAPV